MKTGIQSRPSRSKLRDATQEDWRSKASTMKATQKVENGPTVPQMPARVLEFSSAAQPQLRVAGTSLEPIWRTGPPMESTLRVKRCIMLRTQIMLHANLLLASIYRVTSSVPRFGCQPVNPRVNSSVVLNRRKDVDQNLLTYEYTSVID